MPNFQFTDAVKDHPNFVMTNEAWEAAGRGELPADGWAEDLVVDNGPGAGPWRHIEGKDAFLNMIMRFVPYFQGTWHQDGRCVYADDHVSISLVHETGTAPSGAVFDNRAVYVARFGSEGKVNRLWTTDVDQEAMENFWTHNEIGADD